ncbi:MAG TPA: hypothetical protein VD793_08025, partial [Gemmatimonadales bacterium]|nr:hypothetical protein [Gemmatimonadales bacterium]
PNPTSGFLLVVPHSRIRPLDMNTEDAMKLVISAGATAPTALGPQDRRQGLDLDILLPGDRG